MTFSNEDIIGSLIPNVYVSKIVLQSTEEDTLSMNIQFYIKNRFGSDDVSSWIEDDPEILKYLKLYMFQFSDPETIQILKNVDPSIIMHLAMAATLYSTPDQIHTYLLNKNFKVTRSESEKLLQQIRAASAYRRNQATTPSDTDSTPSYSIGFAPFTSGLTLQQMVERGIAERAETEPGFIEYDIYFEHKFANPLPEDIRDLMLIFFSTFDIFSAFTEQQEIIEGDESNIRLTEQVARQIIENSIFETYTEQILSNGQVVNTTLAFVDREQNRWVGPVHIIVRNGVSIYRSGREETPASVDLQRVEIQNNIVQDYRQLARILDFQRTDINIANTDFISLIGSQPIQELGVKNNSSISQLFHSFDRQKNISLTFALDFKQMFLDNSIYGQVLKTIIDANTKIAQSINSSSPNSYLINDKIRNAKNLTEALYKFAKIESIKIKSKRIDIDDSVNFEKQKEQIVFNTSNEQTIVDIQKAGFVEIEDSSQLKMFSIADTTGKQIGTYEYVLEIGYRDTTKEIISDLIEALKLEQRKFKTYYEYAILPNAFNQTTKKFNLKTFRKLERLKQPTETVVENLSNAAILERIQSVRGAAQFFYSPSMANAAITNLATGSLSGEETTLLEKITTFPESVIIYLSIIQSFFNTDVDTEVTRNVEETFLSTLYNWINPKTATPETISYVIQIYDDLINNLQSIVSLTKYAESSLNEKGDAASPENVDSVSKIITIQKTFNEKVRLNSSYLLEYLDLNRLDNTNISIDNSQTLDSLRIDLLNKKLNQSAKFSTPEQEISIEEKAYDNLDNILGTFGNLSVYDGPEYISNRNMIDGNVSDAVTQRQQNSIAPAQLWQQRLTMAEKSRLLSSDKIALKPLMLELIKPTLTRGQAIKNLLKETYVSKNLFQKITPSEAQIGIQSSVYQGQDVMFETIVNLIQNVVFPKSYLNEIPNQLKSLFQIRTQNSQISINDAESCFKYEMLKKIQFLDGFEFDQVTGTYKMSSPIWLTLKNLVPLTNEARQLMFCRLIDYNDRQISYNYNLSLSERTINEHFFIGRSNLDQQFMIRNGATIISSINFTRRMDDELNKYFSNRRPSVSFTVGTRQIDSDNGYIDTKFSFLAPQGIQFDIIYKVIGNMFGRRTTPI